MSKVWLIDFDGNPIQQECPKDSKSFREIIPSLNYDISFEFILLLDIKDKKLISKYSKNLTPDHCYKLLSAQRLFQHNSEMVEKSIEWKKEIEDLSQQVKNLQQQSESKSEQIQQSENQIKESKGELQKKNQQTQEQLEKLQNESEQLKQDNGKKINEIDQLTEKIAKQNKEIQELTTKRDSLQLNFEQADKERNQLKMDLSLLKNENDLIQSQNKKFEDEIKINRLKTIELDKIINQQNQTLESQKTQLNKRQITIDQYYEQIKEKDQKIYSYMDNFIRLSTVVQQPQKDTSAEQSKINELNQQIQTLQKNMFNNQQAYQELIQKNDQMKEQINQHYDQMNKALENKQKESEGEINNLNIQLTDCKILLEKEQNALEHANKQIKKYLQNINEMDGINVQLEQKIIAHENSKNEVGFRTRLQRLVELSERPYINEINFAIEEIFRQNIVKILTNKELEDQEYRIYKLSITKDKQDTKQETKQNDITKDKQDTKQETKQNDIDLFNTTIYELSNLDFSSLIKTVDTEKTLKGKVCKAPVCSEDHSYDQILIFQSSDSDTNFMKNTQFALRQIKTYQFNEKATQQTAINESVGLLIAQNILDKFNQELGNQQPELKELKFAQPYIFSKQQSFKQFLCEIIDEEKINQYSQVRNIILMMNDLESNQFYDEWRGIQLNKKRYAEFVNQGFVFIFCECVRISCKDNLQKINDLIKQIGEDVIKKEFEPFTQFLDDIHIPSFPVEQFYPAYEIHQSKEGEVFKKYNGGHTNFDPSEVGRFLSAFSYYSIKKSQRQICVSHLQGVGNYLYDPLVSSYDGMLNKLDQGINEIRTIESKCETAKTEDIGEQYLNLLGIQRKQVQLQKID